MSRIPLIAILLVVIGVGVRGQTANFITIHIGPQTRDGFIEVDQGVLDSINDVTRELKKDRRLRVVRPGERAVLELLILGRAVSGSAGAVALPLAGGGAIGVPIPGHTLQAVLKFGDYERPITVNEQDYGTWRRLAVLLSRDVRAWIDANRNKLPN